MHLKSYRKYFFVQNKSAETASSVYTAETTGFHSALYGPKTALSSDKMKIPQSPGPRGISLSIVGFNLELKYSNNAGFAGSNRLKEN